MKLSTRRTSNNTAKNLTRGQEPASLKYGYRSSNELHAAMDAGCVPGISD